MKRILCLLFALLLFVSNAFAALTKAVEEEDAWTAVASNVVVEGATVDVSAHYQSVLTIVTAVTSDTTAANGMEIRVQMSANTAGDEDWIEVTAFQGLTTTSTILDSEAITNNPLAAASTTITCASTTGYTLPTGTDNGWRYIDDGANSEIVLQNGLTLNTNITIVDGTTHAHNQNTLMWNVVGVFVVQIPDAASRVRIVYNNTKDAAGPTYDVMARCSSITGI